MVLEGVEDADGQGHQQHPTEDADVQLGEAGDYFAILR